jgi:hypothetical protein
MIAKTENNTWATAFAKIEAHYFFNKGFFESDSWILDNADKIKHIPGTNFLEILNNRSDCARTLRRGLSCDYRMGIIQKMGRRSHNS